MQKTTKTRLREEFNTGDTLQTIVDRLNAEAMGRALKSGELRPWCQSSLSNTLVEMGLRRRQASPAPSPRTMASSRAAQTRTKNKSASQVLASVQSLLGIDTMDPDERITLAVMAIEGAGYGAS